MNYAKTVSIKKIKEDAENGYGNLSCSEALMLSIHNNFELDLPKDIIKMASGFTVGIGGSKCLCGALAGGVMALGLFFGRDEPADPKIGNAMALSNELHDYFKKATGKNATCCRILTKSFEAGSPDHIAQCRFLTGIAAEKSAEIIIRELELTNID